MNPRQTASLRRLLTLTIVGVLLVVLMLVATGGVFASPSHQEPGPTPPATKADSLPSTDASDYKVPNEVLQFSNLEVLVVPFSLGDQGVETVNEYVGRIGVVVAGVGQASGAAMSDAFYIYTDGEGNPIEPWHPTEFYNWTLWINGGPADAYMYRIPRYRPDHVYAFIIDAPGGRLRFAVGDGGTEDNTGQYYVGLWSPRR